MARSVKTAQARRGTLHWLEIVLPIYAVTIVGVYYRHSGVHLAMPGEGIEDIAVWTAWLVGGALGVMLALSGLFLGFCLLYSPFYLARNLGRALAPGVWIDPNEVRFYFFCFGLLCFLVVLAVLNLELALAVFTILAGSVKLLVRLFA